MKATALERAAIVGPDRAGRELDISTNTIKSWMTRESRKAHAELARADLVLPVRKGMGWAERRARIEPALGELVEEAVAACRLAVQEGRSRAASDFSSVASRLLDRAMTIGGDVTSRSESRSLHVKATAADVERQKVIAQLEAEIEEERQRRALG